jgi:MFS family permease
MASDKPEPIWTRAFALLCLAQFLGYAQHFMLTPTLPLYISHLGGSPFVVGLVIACFAATSVVLRPLLGYWTDRWNEVAVMVSGLLFQGATIFLCFVPVVEVIMLANALRGIGWASMNIGGYSILALTAPAARRGATSGYYSGFQASGTILFPAIALCLIDAPFGGFSVVFAVAAAIAAIAAGIGTFMRRQVPRTARTSQPHKPSSWWREIVNSLERDVLLASALLFCLHLSLPAVTSFLVLYARQSGVENFAWYFVVTGITSLLARPLLGQWSDKIGYARSVAAAFLLQIFAFGLLLVVTGLGGMLVSGVFYMMGNAIGGATTLALAMELAQPERRGRAMATFSLSFPLGNGIGALISGTVVDLAGYIWMFLIAAALCASGLVLTFVNWSKLK